MGEMLATMSEDQTREIRGGDRRSKSPRATLKPTPAALGITKRESVAAQRLASLPQRTFAAVKAGTKTQPEARREARRKEIETQVAVMPTGQYRIITPIHRGSTGTNSPRSTEPRGFIIPQFHGSAAMGAAHEVYTPRGPLTATPPAPAPSIPASFRSTQCSW